MAILATDRTTYADMKPLEGETIAMLRRQQHRRDCHMSGHRWRALCEECAETCVSPRHMGAGVNGNPYFPKVRGCDCEQPKRPACTHSPIAFHESCRAKCPQCWGEASEVWDRKKWKLHREGTALLERAPPAAPPDPVKELARMLLAKLSGGT